MVKGIKAITVELLQVYPPSLLETIDRIIISGNFRPASLPIREGEQSVRDLNPQEIALFTLLVDTIDKYNVISSTPLPSPLEELLVKEYEERIEFYDNLLMKAITLHPMTEDLSHGQIGIRAGHVVVILPERNLDFVFEMFRPNCMLCPGYLDCENPDKIAL